MAIHSMKRSMLVLEDSLGVLRRTLPWLGWVLVAAMAVAIYEGQVGITQAITVACLGAGAAIWSRRAQRCRFEFDPAQQLVHITFDGRSADRHLTLAFRDVKDIVAEVADGLKSSDQQSLSTLSSFRLVLITERQRFPLTRDLFQSLRECEQFEIPIWQVLGRRAELPLLDRSYRAAIVKRDRLQAVSIMRLLNPAMSLEEADGAVRTSMSGSS